MTCPAKDPAAQGCVSTRQQGQAASGLVTLKTGFMPPALLRVHLRPCVISLIGGHAQMCKIAEGHRWQVYGHKDVPLQRCQGGYGTRAIKRTWKLNKDSFHYGKVHARA